MNPFTPRLGLLLTVSALGAALLHEAPAQAQARPGFDFTDSAEGLLGRRDAGPRGDAGLPDGGRDAGFDAGVDAGVDAGMDAGPPDAGTPPSLDAGPDAGALPKFDGGLGPPAPGQPPANPVAPQGTGLTDTGCSAGGSAPVLALLALFGLAAPWARRKLRRSRA